ncbi:MAG: LuxR C-terminal-related transcriptional regulator [Elusimicrobiota bacterium]
MNLTEKEKTVLEKIVEGKSNKIIAQELSLSENTIKVELRYIFFKIGAKNRTQAAVLAIRNDDLIKKL